MNHESRVTSTNRGFTLIELLVVVAIIGLLSTMAVIAFGSVRSRARDARRKADLKQLSNAAELYFMNNDAYPGTAGYLSNPNHGGLDFTLGPIMKVPDDPRGGSYVYQYWRKDFRGYACMTAGTVQQYAFYAILENPTANDTATISDSFDVCVRDTWGMNYKMGSP
jgi:type II secretion system protein G